MVGMSYSVTFEYNEMIGTVEMKKEDGGILFTLTASAPEKKKKYSHFIIPGTGVTVEAGTMTVFSAALKTTIVWRILAQKPFMENYNVEIDFTGEHPIIELWRGVPKLVPSRTEYVQLLGYAFTAPSSSRFTLSKKEGEMTIKQKE
jgi:hypothetical protein